MRRSILCITVILNLLVVASCTSGLKNTGIRIPAKSDVTYYVDVDFGDDQNDGLSEAKPWKSIAKVNNTELRPGDTVLFKRNRIWNEKLVVRSSGEESAPITFGSYGSGSFPIISGAIEVSRNEWREIRKNVWATSLAQDDNRKPERIFVDGIPVEDRLLKQTSSELIKEREWAWESVDGGKLFIFSMRSPSSWKKLIEVNVLRYAIHVGAQKFIRIEGFGLMRAREGLWMGGENCEIEHVIANENSFTGLTVVGKSNIFRSIETSKNGVDIMPGRTDARGLGILVEGSFNDFSNFVSSDNSEDGVQTSPSAGSGNRFINATMKGNRENCFDIKAGDQEIAGGILHSDGATSADCILVHKVPHHVKIEKVTATSTSKGPVLTVNHGASVEIRESNLISDESSAILIGETAGDKIKVIGNRIGPGGKKSKILVDIRGGKQHLIQQNELHITSDIEPFKVAPLVEASISDNQVFLK